MTLNASASHLNDARQLLRLRELRERTALAALRRAETAQRAAQAVVDEHQHTMRRLLAERQQLAQRVVGELAGRIGRLADCVTAVQADLDDQLERTEYALSTTNKPWPALGRRPTPRARPGCVRCRATARPAPSSPTPARRCATRAPRGPSARTRPSPCPPCDPGRRCP